MSKYKNFLLFYGTSETVEIVALPNQEHSQIDP